MVTLDVKVLEIVFVKHVCVMDMCTVLMDRMKLTAVCIYNSFKHTYLSTYVHMYLNVTGSEKTLHVHKIIFTPSYKWL